MSGNSSRRRRTTSPILSRRSRCGFCVAALFTGARSTSPVSPLHERQPVLAVLELVAVDPAAVDERAVQRPLVLDEEPAVALDEQRVVARHRDIVEEDVAVGGASDAGAVAARPECLAGAAAARADDERGPLEAVDGALGEVADVVGRQRLRRLDRRLALLDQSAAARAVVRGLRVLEPAFLAV